MTESSHKQTVDQLFDEAIAFERKAAETYVELSRLFSHYPEVSAVWNNMRDDELFHADVLENLRTELSHKHLSSAVEQAVWKKVISVNQLLGGDLIGPIRNLRDAYELAHQLEASEVNAIFQFLIEVMPNPERKRFVLSMLKQHLERLYDLDRKYQGKMGMSHILARRTLP